MGESDSATNLSTISSGNAIECELDMTRMGMTPSSGDGISWSPPAEARAISAASIVASSGIAASLS